MAIELEKIKAWDGQSGTGADARGVIDRNFEKVKDELESIDTKFSDVEDEIVQLAGDMEVIVEKYYTGLGGENFFSKSDIVKYPVLRLFKKVWITGLQREVDKINTLSLTGVYGSPSNDQLWFYFNVNGVSNNGIRWESSYSINIDTTSIPDIITATSNNGSATQGIFNTRIHVEFDYSAFDRNTMNIDFTSISPDRRVFLTEDFVQNMKLGPNTIAEGTQLAKANRRAILGELPFYKKDYIDVDILQHFYDLKITNVKNELFSLSITNLSVTGGKLQMIINQNNRTSGDIWEQSIVINADIPSDGNEVIFSGFSSNKPLCNFEVKLNLAEWDRDINLNAWARYNGQYIADDKAIHILPEYIEKLKKGDTIEGVYRTFGELANGVTEIGQEARLGGLLYERIADGADERSFRRNFSYKIPKNDTLKIVDVAARTRFTYTMDITEDGVIRGLEPDGRYITYFNSFEEMKSYPPSDVGNILYDLRAMNAEFTGVLRYWWQLNNGNILINERTEGDDIGGLWILNTVEDTLYKVFTFRNKWQWITIGGWSIDFAGDTIYLSEYGNSPADSGIGIKADATKLWKSEDFGETWVEVYDFKNIPGVIATGLHIHSVHYDKTWDRLWVTTGDSAGETGSSKMLLWSDDRGDSWSKLDLMEYWGSPSNPLNSAQGLSMYSTENFLLIGGDDFQNCIYRVAKVSKNDTPEIEIVYRYNPIYNDRITQYTARWQRLSNGMIVVALINGDHFPRRNRIMGTFDGLKWYELWSDAETSDTWGTDGILIEHEGHLYLQIMGITPNTDSVAHNLIKFEIDYAFI